MKQRLKDIIYIALFAVIIALCSWISVPFVLPFTMQTFAVGLALFLLGGKRGTVTMLVYITLGIIGLPVFAAFGSGIGTLMGATGGYIVGFVAMALVYWLVTVPFKDKQIIAAAAGLAVCYAFGSLWYCLVYAQSSAQGFWSAFALCVLPYVLPDIAKLALAYLLSKRLSKII